MTIYILTGSDTVSRSEFIQSQKANCDPKYLAINVHHYSHFELADAVFQFNTPAWIDRSLVIVEGKTIGKEDLAIISQLDRTSNNVLLLNLDSLDGRLSVTKYLKQIGKCKQFDIPNHWESYQIRLPQTTYQDRQKAIGKRQ
jgi:DNA polymerase III delta subunit